MIVFLRWPKSQLKRPNSFPSSFQLTKWQSWCRAWDILATPAPQHKMSPKIVGFLKVGNLQMFVTGLSYCTLLSTFWIRYFSIIFFNICVLPPSPGFKIVRQRLYNLRLAKGQRYAASGPFGHPAVDFLRGAGPQAWRSAQEISVEVLQMVAWERRRADEF